MRVFAALDVPRPVVQRIEPALAPLREEHPALNWTPSATWHVTLAFLGEVDGSRLDDVEAAVTAAVREQAEGPIELSLAGAGTFGDRVAWLRVEDRPRGVVARLGSAVQDEVAGRSLPVDRKDVRPHVTLARARGRRGRLPAGFVDDLPELDVAWTVEEAVVFRSHLGSGPLEHEPLVRVALSPGGARSGA